MKKTEIIKLTKIVLIFIISAGFKSNAQSNDKLITGKLRGPCSFTASFANTSWTNGLITFTNNSTGTFTGMVNTQWDFGDGNSANVPFSTLSVSNTYTSNGLYMVSMVIGNGTPWCNDTFRKVIVVSSVVTNLISLSQNDQEISIYPVPSHGEFKIKTSVKDTFVITDSSGKILDTFKVKGGFETLSFSGYTAGIYYVKGISTKTMTKIIVE